MPLAFDNLFFVITRFGTSGIAGDTHGVVECAARPKPVTSSKLVKPSIDNRVPNDGATAEVPIQADGGAVAIINSRVPASVHDGVTADGDAKNLCLRKLANGDAGARGVLDVIVADSQSLYRVGKLAVLESFR